MLDDPLRVLNARRAPLDKRQQASRNALCGFQFGVGLAALPEVLAHSAVEIDNLGAL
jgi:hypothetical protein